MKKEIDQLKSIFNLSTYEARLYLAALNFDHVSISDMARKTRIPRTACYKPVEKLVSIGMLSPIKVKKRTFYEALQPKNLSYMLERKQVELKDMVSSLEQQITVPDRQLAISYYEGREGVMVATDILLEEAKGKKGKSWEDVDKTGMQTGATQLTDYINKRVKKGIFGEMIATSSGKNKFINERLKNDKKELRKTILVDPKKYPLKSSVAVIDDMTMILTSGENPFAVLIRNKDIATTMWSIHEMYWDRYKK